MLIREKVQKWFDESPEAYVCVLDWAPETSGKTAKHLRNRHDFPFDRDALEIWRRWHSNWSEPIERVTWKNKFLSAEDIKDVVLIPAQPTLSTRLMEYLEDAIPDELLTKWPRLYVILPDQQVPYHDKFLHELVLRWLETNHPHGKIYSGDLVDLPGVSRYDWNPEMVSDPLRSTAEAITETIKVLQEYSQAGGIGDDWLIEGNHELRLFKYLVSRAPELFYLQEENGEQTLDLYRLLGLQKLGVNIVPGRWPQGKHWISPKLAVIHGRYARQGSGVTARATLKALGHSVIMGHSHRQSMIYETQHPYGGPETRVAVEAGTLAMLEGGLGYSPEPDWQQGGCVVRLFEDGTFHISLMTYTKGALYWEGQVYRNTGHGVITSV